VNAQIIEESLAVAPPIEWTLFSNRDKFDLVAMYDASSDTFGPKFQALERAIFERAFRKMLKRMPVLLVGGLRAWKAEFGEEGVIRGEFVEEEDAEPEVYHHQRHRAEHRSEPEAPDGYADSFVAPSTSSFAASSFEPGVSVGRTRAQTESGSSTRMPDYAYRDNQFSTDAGPSRSPLPSGPAGLPGLTRRSAVSRPPSTQLPTQSASSGVRLYCS
jgi:ubiquitin carboxyl-terminal hydrolase 8